MTTRVQLRHIETGLVTEHFSVDARDIVKGGEYVYHDPSRPTPKPGEPPQARLKHAGGGRWNVLNADGSQANEAPLSKLEAEALLATLT